MFTVRVLAAAKGESSGGTTYLRDEEIPTRREAVARIRYLGNPGPKFLEEGRKVMTVIIPSAGATGKK